MKLPINITYKVDRAAFKQEILVSLAKKNNVKAFERNLRVQKGELLVKKIERAIKAMVKDFLSLKITQEILGGPQASNISGTLGGYGNLFSFIGFSAGTEPITPILKLLNQTSYRLTQMNVAGKMRLTVDMPDKQTIFAVTPLPWASGISWAERMEVGLSGLGMYLHKKSDRSRSGDGVQAGHPLRSARFLNAPYISAFINKWHDIFSKIDQDIKLK